MLCNSSGPTKRVKYYKMGTSNPNTLVIKFFYTLGETSLNFISTNNVIL